MTRVWVLPLPLTSCALHCRYLLACCCCSVAKLSLTLCCNRPGFSILHYLPKFAHIHVQWVDDASNYLILFCPLLLLISIFLSIRIFSNESVIHVRCQSTGVSVSASVLPMNIQNWIPLGLTGLIPLLSKELSRVFSSTTFQKHQFFGSWVWNRDFYSLHHKMEMPLLVSQNCCQNWIYMTAYRKHAINRI